MVDHVDLERQLRRYADHVEGAVGETAVEPVPTRPRSPRLAVAAVVALVAAIGLAFVVVDRDSGSDVDIDPARDGSLEPTAQASDSNAEGDGGVSAETPPEPKLMPAGEIPPAPLSPRSSTLTIRIGDEVVVWGGDRDALDEVYGDGAVYDIATNEWRAMAESPIPLTDDTPTAIDLEDRLFVSRRQHAAYYSVADDVWTELPSLSGELIRELRHAPEIDSIFALGARGVYQFDLSTDSWSELGGRGDSIEWTGEKLVSVTGDPGGSFPVDTWTASTGWVEETTIETGVSQVAIDTGLVDGEVWIVGYDMTVDVWDPVTGEQRSLPPLPIDFTEGVPRVFVSSAAGPDVVLVDREPGLVTWSGEGWEVRPRLDIAYGATLDSDGTGGGAWWGYWFDGGTPDNALVVSQVPTPGDPREIVLGSVVLELAPEEQLIEMGVGERDDGFEPWAVISAEIGRCRLDDAIGERVDGTVDIVLGSNVISVTCDDPEAPRRLAPRLRSVDVDDERTAYILGQSLGTPDGLVPVSTVVGLFADTAMATLRNEGLVPVTEFRVVPFGDPQVGVVLAQAPIGFTEVEPGTQVVITVGEAGPDPDQ